MAILSACGDAPERSRAAGGGTFDLQASDVHVVGTSDAIAAVHDLEVLPGGSVWVLNSIEPFFIGFDPAGSVVQTHGRRGGGPDEFGAPAGFVTGGIDGNAWVFDRERHALVEVSRPGQPRSEIPIPREAIPPGTVLGGIDFLNNTVRIGRLGDELILPRRSSLSESDVFSYWLSVWSADLLALQPADDSARTVVAIGEVLGDPRPHYDLSDRFLPFPLWYRLWAVCSDAEIRLYDRLRNQVRRFTGDGSELEPLPLPPVRHDEITPRQFARVTFDIAVVEKMGAVDNASFDVSPADSARILDEIVQRTRASPDQLANLVPRYVDFRCGDDGTQWLRPLDLDVGGLKGGPLWLRVGADGEVDELRLPDRFDPYRFTTERIWGVQRDEFDVASIAWIALPPMR